MAKLRWAFVVRPFGVRGDVNFEHIEKVLIAPALKALGIHGRTTQEFFHQGNIREEMFQELLTADLVIADISLLNANVFYELGIRHALQDKHTFLIRSSIEPVPFDLKTDRYLKYDHERPQASLKLLIDGLRRSLDRPDADSPVHQLLPALRASDRERFIRVPGEFAEAVEQAQNHRRHGDLDLFAAEIQSLGLPWSVPGLRLVGEAQFKLGSWDTARETWETLRELDPSAYLPNARLATIYQKQKRPDLVKSDQAVDRALEDPDVSQKEQAELYALAGSNRKTTWLEGWSALATVDERRREALRSGMLDRSTEDYKRGFETYLNHYYSGLNALALVAVRHEVAIAMRDIWDEQFPDEDEADFALKKLKQQRGRLAAAVNASLLAAKAGKGGGDDPWLEISIADHAVLTDKKPQFVKNSYGKALGKLTPQAADSVRRQLDIFCLLEVFPEQTEAGLAAADERQSGSESAAPGTDEEIDRVVIFTGHRVDAPGRETPRFPASAESVATEMIREKLQAERDQVDGKFIGYAGGASGGDIIFHELCEELGIDSWLYLAGERKDYVVKSVQYSGGDWVQRFDTLLSKKEAANKVRYLTINLELPRWLRTVQNFSIWEHNNLWTLHNALSHGAENVLLLALWDGRAGDGPGGTKDMIERAGKQGARTEIISALSLKDL